ncbi:MAG: GH92 family glycosyl hydrolase [Bacteroidota bacterium]
MVLQKSFIIVLLLFLFSCSVSDKDSKISYVDPFIGTDGSGQTYPGASLPFGMVQLSPDTRNDATQKACAGYHYSDNTILGFSHTHLSGVGQVDYTDILFMPTVGKVNFYPGEPENPDSGYRSSFRHTTEKASPGYYSVELDDYNIQAELTTTLRAGFHRYTFPESDESNIIIDLKHKESKIETVLDSYINIVDKNTVEGYRRTNGVMAFDHTFYFVAEFSKPFSSYNIALDDNIEHNVNQLSGKNIKSSLHFKTSENEQVLVRVGISAVDMEGARKNLKAEIKDWNFERVVKKAEDIWEKELNRIEIESDNKEVKRIFYTSMYHAFLAPQIFMDVDGRYVSANNAISKSDDFTNYTALSLWDTFRAWHPLFTIIDQKRTGDFIKSLLKLYEGTGRLPMWPLTGSTYDGMLGFHATSVITDAYVKGIDNFDIDLAYEAMKTTMMSNAYGLNYYKNLGYIPCDLEGESVSKTLEYSYNDWCVATLAKELGKKDDYEYFNARAQFYTNVFDTETNLMRGRYSDHNWFAPFDPFVNSNYSEGNAWQYTFVPHDTKGLIELIGGEAKFDLWLDDFFTLENPNNRYDHGGVIGQYVHGNEPDHHMAYLYNYVGKAWKSQKIVRKILQEHYNDGPNGLSGNEDCGQMSAWYIFSSMGFYPFNPGQDMYVIGSPLIEKAIINLENGKQFKIIAHNQSPDNIYIQSVKLNGKEYNLPYLKHKDIIDGGKLEFVMGNIQNETWASDIDNCPPSENGKDVVSTPYIKSGDVLFEDQTTVSLSCDNQDAQIYYTLDGRSPDRKSNLYQNPFTTDKTTVVKFKAYRKGVLPSIIVEQKFEKAEYAKVSQAQKSNKGIKYCYYEGAFSSVDQIDSFEAKEKGISSAVNIDKRQRDNYFAFNFSGYIKVPDNGIYTFFLESNDGSSMYVNGRQIIENDNYHIAKELQGKIALAAGFHKIEVKYFQAGGGKELKLSWKGPKIEKQEIIVDNLFYDIKNEDE